MIKFINYDKFESIMTQSVAKVVWNILDKDLVLQYNLKRGIINIRALAKYFIKYNNIDSSLDSVISAIRRYEPRRYIIDQKVTPDMLIKGAKVSTRSNIASISIRKVANASNYLSQLSLIGDQDKGDAVRIIKGEKNLKILTDEKNLNDIVRLFNKDIVEVKEGLGEVSLLIGMEADDTRGVLAHVGTEMMLAGVNICEMIWCVPEILIYVNKDDLLKVHERLLRLANH